MSTTSRRFFTGFALGALACAGLACSSNPPLRMPGDAASGADLAPDAAPDLRTGEPAADVARDVAEPELPAVPPPPADTAPVLKDALTADVPAAADAKSADARVPAETAPEDLPASLPDAPLAEVLTQDVPPADLVSRDGAAEHPLPCSDGGGGCNDNPAVSSIWGTCQPDGTCACTPGHVVNPATGRCMMAPVADASPSVEAGGACTGEYTACGCGCCGSTATNTACYYPSLGETIATVTAADQATKSATNCALAGCSIGIHYLCCAPVAPDPPSSATYAAEWYIGGLDHVRISKTGADCANLSFARPLSTPNSALRITMPPSWNVEMASFGPCGDAGAVASSAKGAVGTYALRASGTSCLADVHVTLFAFAADGTVLSARLDIDGLAMPGISAGMCQ